MATSSTFDTSNQYVKYNITVNVNSQNIANNTSNVSVTVRFWRTNTGYETYGTGSCYCWIETVGAQTQSVTSSQRITNSGINLFSWTGNIPHNADGSKSIWVSSYININTPLTSNDQGFTAALPTIPRASSVSGGSGNIGGTSTVSISRASSSFTHILYYSFGSLSWQWIASNVGTSYTWTLPSALYGQIPNANSGTGTMICETYSGSTYIGTAYSSFTANVVNSNPSFTAPQLTYKDSNASIVAITGNDQLIVRNQSTLQATFTTATALNSSSISKYQTIFNGTTTDRSSAGTYSFGVLNVSQNLTLQVKAIDSRGNSTTISKTVTILDWVAPIINATAARINNYENQTSLIANVQISSVNGINSIQALQYRYKKTTDSAWGSWTNLSNYTQVQLNLDNLFAWDLQVQAIDKFGTTTQNLSVSKGMPIAFFDTQKLSVGINCFPAKSSSLEVNGKTIFDMIYPVGAIYMSVSSVNPSALFGGTWVSWAQGQVPVGVASSGTFNTVEKTGGAETVTLTTSQIPAHQHSVYAEYGTNSNLNFSPSAQNYMQLAGTSAGTRSSQSSPMVSGGGSGSSHTNLQPYITCYFFKRTA